MLLYLIVQKLPLGQCQLYSESPLVSFPFKFRPVEVQTKWNPASAPLSCSNQTAYCLQPEGTYDYSHDSTSGAYEVPSDPYDIYDTTSIYDDIQPEGPLITSAAVCSSDMPQTTEISLCKVPKILPSEVTPDVQEQCLGSLEDVI